MPFYGTTAGGWGYWTGEVFFIKKEGYFVFDRRALPLGLPTKGVARHPLCIPRRDVRRAGQPDPGREYSKGSFFFLKMFGRFLKEGLIGEVLFVNEGGMRRAYSK
jgi:hypothetical protein